MKSAKRIKDRIYARIPIFIIAILVIFIALLLPRMPAVTHIKGAVRIYDSEKGRWIAADKRAVRLKEGDSVKTLIGGEADIVVRAFYHMRLKDNSEIKLMQHSAKFIKGKVRYHLSHGRVLVHYSNTYGGRSEFGIETLQAAASVIGTVFSMEASPLLGKTWVGVLEGVVSVKAVNALVPHKEGQDTVIISQGEKTTVLQRRVPAEPSPLTERELLELNEKI